MSAGDVQQRDGACEHLAVSIVPSGDVLRGDGPDWAERQVQRRLLLQRGGGGGECERMRRTDGVQRHELRRMRGDVSGGVILPCGIGAADAMRRWAVLRDRRAVAGERALRRRVLLRERGGLEREA